MLERDYLGRQFLVFFQAIVRACKLYDEKGDALSSARSIEDAISAATEIDGDALLSLAPESVASVMQVSGIDASVAEYVARGLMLEAFYLSKGGLEDKAELRAQQALALGGMYDFELPGDFHDVSALEKAAIASSLLFEEDPSAFV